MQRTVFVIGAGASKEADLPVGKELAEKVADLLNFKFEDGMRVKSGSPKIFEVFCNVEAQRAGAGGRQDLNPYIAASRSIHKAMPLAPSIDNFIHTHSGDEQIALAGKLAITEAILAAERRSLLYFKLANIEDTINFRALEKTWYVEFMQRLNESGTIADVEKRLSNICFIVFNYDRCLEHFLFHAFRLYYKISDDAALSLLSKIEIIHPYGSTGRLPWERSPSATIDFGGDPSASMLLKLSRGIRTFTEGTDSEVGIIDVIRERVWAAERLVFMGFAFLNLNLDLLLPHRTERMADRTVWCLGTVSGISEHDQHQIKTQLIRRGAFSEHHVQLSSSYCHNFLAGNRFGLSFQ